MQKSKSSWRTRLTGWHRSIWRKKYWMPCELKRNKVKKVRAELSLLEEILMEQNRLVEELLRWGQEELEALTNDDFGRLLRLPKTAVLR